MKLEKKTEERGKTEEERIKKMRSGTVNRKKVFIIKTKDHNHFLSRKIRWTRGWLTERTLQDGINILCTEHTRMQTNTANIYKYLSGFFLGRL